MAVFGWSGLPYAGKVLVVVRILSIQPLPHHSVSAVPSGLHMLLANEVRMPLVPAIRRGFTQFTSHIIVKVRRGLVRSDNPKVQLNVSLKELTTVLLEVPGARGFRIRGGGIGHTLPVDLALYVHRHVMRTW